MQSELIAERRWRTMIILDACRRDVFARCIGQTRLTGVAMPVNSNVIHTEAWYMLNWQGPAPDVVLASGHPKPWDIHLHNSFYRALPLWKLDSFPEPGPVLDEAVKAAREYSAHRLLVHLVPPHLPYVGPRGQAWQDKHIWSYDADTPGLPHDGKPIYTIVREYGAANGWDELRGYYAESLLTALGCIERVIGRFKPPVVITADHGELIGEDGQYRHEIMHPAVQTVPWFEVTT